MLRVLRWWLSAGIIGPVARDRLLNTAAHTASEGHATQLSQHLPVAWASEPVRRFAKIHTRPRRAMLRPCYGHVTESFQNGLPNQFPHRVADLLFRADSGRGRGNTRVHIDRTFFRVVANEGRCNCEGTLSVPAHIAEHARHCRFPEEYSSFF